MIALTDHLQKQIGAIFFFQCSRRHTFAYAESSKFIISSKTIININFSDSAYANVLLMCFLLDLLVNYY